MNLNNVTLNQIVAILRDDLYINHKMVNDFGFGPTSEIGKSREMKYPYFWLSLSESSILQSDNNQYSSIDYSFVFIIADKINDTLNLGKLGELSNNGIEVTSDTLQILSDYITRISTHPFYIKNGIKLIDDIIYTPVFDEDDGRVNGISANISLRIPFRLTYCNSPFIN